MIKIIGGITIAVFAIAYLIISCNVSGRSDKGVVHFSIDDLSYGVYGSSFLGSGGGGALSDGMAILEKIAAVAPYGIDVYSVDEASDDDFLCVPIGIGAPDALRGKMDELVAAIKSSIDTLSQFYGKKITGILPGETGAVNLYLAMYIATQLDLKLYDCAGAGRSVPSLNNATYSHQPGITIYPIALSAPSLQPNQPSPKVLMLYPNTVQDAENQIRNIISTDPAFGELGALALWAQSGSLLKSSNVIRNVIQDAVRVGKAITNQTELDSVLTYLPNALTNPIYSAFTEEGTIIDVQNTTIGGFDVGEVKIGYGNTVTIIQNVNENMLSKQFAINVANPDTTFITAPTLISYLIRDDSTSPYIPYNNGDDLSTMIGKKVVLIYSYADPELYNTSDGMAQSFLDILQDFNYSGPITPTYPTNGKANGK